jgi:hypothetical protein
MADRHVALGDCQQAGKARLRCEQIVEARVELLLGDPIADVEQVPKSLAFDSCSQLLASACNRSTVSRACESCIGVAACTSRAAERSVAR